MASKDGQRHSRDGTQSITLENPANSNEPINNKNKLENEEANNPTKQLQIQMQMLQQLIEGQREAKESHEILRNDIRKIQHSNNEIIETVNHATAKAEEAQIKANEATKQAKEKI